ncbi:hypothetical protein [Mycolicibacterium sp.]|uniref:hypothetical protein n=1 Tax=Mycolicibacterium sp. TaxID=2320850 RepID=UPI0037CA94B0
MTYKIGAALVIALTATSISLAAPAQAKELGGVDVLKYCGNINNGPLQGTVGTRRDPGNAYSWQCTYQGNWPDPVHTKSVDMNRACSQQHGNGAWAKPLDPKNAYSWRCYR